MDNDDVPLLGRVFMDKRQPECAHAITQGCYHCCDTCNHDAHRCRGCGIDIPHGHTACLDCAEL